MNSLDMHVETIIVHPHGDYRLGRVIEVEIDQEKLLSNIPFYKTSLNKQKNFNMLVYLTVKYIRVSVQRLVLILPREEQEDFPDVTEDEVTTGREETQNTRSVCQHIFYETEDKVSLLRRDNGLRRNMVVTVNLREQVNEFLTILSQKDSSDRTVNISKTDE